jgi:hypothetical protein
MAMPLGRHHFGVTPEENSEVRTRMPELFDAFDNLEKELKQHIKRLRIQAVQIRWEQQARKIIREFRPGRPRSY